MGLFLVVITIMSTVIGILFNTQYKNKYYESALSLGWCIIQTIFVFCALVTIPDPNITGWFIFWCVGTVVSYKFGLSSCKQCAISMDAETEDIKKIMIAQFLLPIGTALILAIIIVLFSTDKKRKK